MPTQLARFAGSDVYNAQYYGAEQPYTANYRNYGAHSKPHWAKPLALWLHEHARGPIVDVGCAFGHLVRELNALHLPAVGVEWSQYAYDRRVSEFVERADARALPYPVWQFNTVVSLDLLEHFEPLDTVLVMTEMRRVARPGALFVQVIGAHNPEEDIARHLSDSTHKNHEPLEWYVERFAAQGVTLDALLTESLQTHAVFAPTDWAGRILAFRGEA